MAIESYAFAFLYTAVLTGIAALYTWKRREDMGEMARMMAGMVFAMVPGFAVGTLYALAFGNFLWAMIVGTVAGALVGVPLGRLGGSLGRMEAVAGAPMAALMGAMTGLMVRVYDLQVFMAFFFLLLIFILGEYAYVVYKSAGRVTPRSQIIWAGLVVLALFATSLAFNYSVDPLAGIPVGGASVGGAVATVVPTLGGGAAVQEATVRIGPFSYAPSTVPLRAGVPARVTFTADADAGCGRALVIPAFGIKKLIPSGGSETVEFTPAAPGTYVFRCGMNMVRGQFVVS